MKKRIASILMAGLMTFSIFGCGSQAPAAETSDNTQTETKADTTETAPAAEQTENTEAAAIPTDEQITLNMWCIATESDSNRHAYEAAIAEMAEKYPNITLNWEAFENQSYKTKIKAAVSANDGHAHSLATL